MMPRWFGRGRSEVDPVLRAEVLLETSRAEARVAILEILLAVAFGLLFGFSDDRFRGAAWFCLFTVVPLLVDATVRRIVSARLRTI